jgi:hypothetical protein
VHPNRRRETVIYAMKSTRTLFSARKLPFALPTVALVVALGSAACGGSQPSAKTPGGSKETPAERTAKIKRWFSREIDPVATHRVELFDGFASGEIESKTDIRPECTNTEAGMACTVIADLGPDKDDPQLSSNVVCTVGTTSRAFGPVLKATALSGAQLDETPVLEVKTIGEGLAAFFVANTTEQQGDNVLVGTGKFAALYAHGYMVACFDKRAGGRKTFDRITNHFFESLKFKSTVTVFASGYQVRMGDRTSGIKFSSIAKRPGDDTGFVEQTSYFHLETDGKTWSMKDLIVVAERDGHGTIEKMEYLFWNEGEGPALLSAKPSEDKKFRLKFEIGDKANGLESTPKAPLNTELWAAPELARVSAGTAATYRYAFLDLVDSDPAFRYLTITRSAPRVLSEVQDELPSQGAKHAGPTPAPTKDELQVDARGLVTKEVSSQSVTELVHTWGNLPPVLSGAKDAGQKPAKQKKNP